MTDHQLAGIPIHQPLVTLARITMVLSKDELVGLLTHEVNVLRHLITKIDATSVDYRPTDSQRSSIELVRYLVMQGPAIVQAIKTGTFDGKAWARRRPPWMPRISRRWMQSWPNSRRGTRITWVP